MTRTHPRYYELLTEMQAICEAKNDDYADDASDPLRNFRLAEIVGLTPFEGVLVRITDKLIRVCNLNQKHKQGRLAGVPEEKVTETLVDLSNYALLAAVLYEEQEAHGLRRRQQTPAQQLRQAIRSGLARLPVIQRDPR